MNNYSLVTIQIYLFGLLKISCSNDVIELCSMNWPVGRITEKISGYVIEQS